MECPNCKVLNEKSATKCQCGYVFVGYKENTYDTSPTVKNVKSDISTSSVVIHDIRMDFISMVVFMVKWALASIPALIILFFIGFGLLGVLGIGIGTVT